MAADLRFRLSTLQPLSEFLVQGLDPTAGLLDTLEESLPGRSNDKMLEALAKLLEHERSTEAIVRTVAYLLDEWLQKSDVKLMRVNQQMEPFTWLATSDHLEVVQHFRQLL